MSAAKTSPTDPRPCTVCGDLILLAKSSVSGNWRPFSAFPADDMLRPFAWVLIGTQAWPKTDLIEHYMVTRELGEAKARDLVEDYPHHLLHPHTTKETQRDYPDVPCRGHLDPHHGEAPDADR